MSEVLTLEELRDQVWAMMPAAGFDAAFNAAITERDELRAQASALKTEANGWFGRVEMVEGKLCDAVERSEKAEAKLAALRERIAAAPGTTARSYFGPWCKIKEDCLPDEWAGKTVRLLVEDDDEH